MTKKTTKRIHLLYGIVLSVALIIAGLCLMAVCVEIYRSGDQPFSRETVALGFSQIAIPVYFCVALVIGGLILHFFLPFPVKKESVKQYPMILKRLLDKNDLSQINESLRESIVAEHKRRKLFWIIFAALFTIGSFIFLIYALNPDNFHQTEINGSMVSAMYVMLPCMIVPFIFAVIASYLSKKSMICEIDLVKQAIASGCPKKQPAESKASPMLIPRLALLCVGILFLVYGFWAGGTIDVLTKAINICTECVGLG